METYKEKFKQFIFDAVNYLEELLDNKGTVFFYNYGRDEIVKFINQEKYSFLKPGDKFIDRFLLDIFAQEAIPLKAKTDRRFFTFQEDEKSKLVELVLKKTEDLQQD